MDDEDKKFWSQRILGRVVGTYKIKRYIFTRADLPFDKCEKCRQRNELLPTGPNDEWICRKCSTADPENHKKKLDRITELREEKRKTALNEQGVRSYERIQKAGSPVYRSGSKTKK